ncbi:hypothetical protein GW17_00045089 [Ensete ventricosum]|nr:hypothetical protein GW17_00045089 [Ensete ventricosum]
MSIAVRLLLSWRLGQHCATLIKYDAGCVCFRPSAAVSCRVGEILVSWASPPLALSQVYQGRFPSKDKKSQNIFGDILSLIDDTI